MTFDQVWDQLTRKRPSLERSESVVEFTAGNLRRLLRQAYEQGEKSVACEPPASGDLMGAFSDIFGGGQ